MASVAEKPEIVRDLAHFPGGPSSLEAVTRGEIDVQIATAKKFPRSPELFVQQATALVSLSPRLAEKCTYALPRYEGGKKKILAGPSVRLAEIVAVSWKNLRIVGRITQDDGKAIVAEGICHDLESNVAYSVEVRRGVLTKNGDRFSADMVNVTCNAAIAIATRNATFKAVPRALVNIIHETAQEVARGTLESLPDRRNRILDWFGSQGIKDAEVYAVLGVNGWADLGESQLATLQGFQVAIEEGATVDEIFRPKPAAADPRRPGENAADALTRRIQEQAAAAEESPPSPRESAEDWADGHEEE